MAILNSYQSFWEKLSEKIWNSHYWPFQTYNQSFRGKLLEKIQNGHFWPFQIHTSLFGKNCQKIFGMANFGHSKFIPVFLGKIVRKFGMAIFGNSKFIPVFLGKIVGKNLEQPLLAIPNL